MLNVFQELSLDLDSHKSIIMSLNVVVNHVADYAGPNEKRAADKLRTRLASANNRWEAVCKSAGRTQSRLQAALMEASSTVSSLVCELKTNEQRSF